MRGSGRPIIVGLGSLSLVLGSWAYGFTTSPASADGGSHHVYRTDGDGVWLHDVPSIHDGLISVLPENAEFIPECYKTSETVYGNPVWLYGSSGDQTGFVTDYYIDTHWSTLADLEAQGIVPCDSASEGPVLPSGSASSQATLEPVDIHLYVDGTRERNLLAMSSTLQSAADAAAVSGQELARVIYHEGGNYLDGTARQTLTENAETLYPYAVSVGIGQITPETARIVEEDVYGTDIWDDSDGVIQSRLIYDQGYALRIAAGKLRMLQDLGLGYGWPQFMAYSLHNSTAAAWKAQGHPMDSVSLESLGIGVSKFQARQQYYNDTINAIG